GVVVWVVGDQTIKGSESGSSFRQALYFMEIGFNLHDTMIYHRIGRPLTHNRYEQQFEYMFVFSKGKPRVFNGLREPSKHAGELYSYNYRAIDGELKKKTKVVVTSADKLRGNIWTYSVGGR